MADSTTICDWSGLEIPEGLQYGKQAYCPNHANGRTVRANAGTYATHPGKRLPDDWTVWSRWGLEGARGYARRWFEEPDPDTDPEIALVLELNDLFTADTSTAATQRCSGTPPTLPARS